MFGQGKVDLPYDEVRDRVTLGDDAGSSALNYAAFLHHLLRDMKSDFFSLFVLLSFCFQMDGLKCERPAFILKGK